MVAVTDVLVSGMASPDSLQQAYTCRHHKMGITKLAAPLAQIEWNHRQSANITVALKSHDDLCHTWFWAN